MKFILFAFLPALALAYQLQEDEVTFYLYARNQTELQITSANICEIKNTLNDFKFIIHGWIAAHNNSWVTELTNAYLKSGDYNVIHVDWSRLAAEPASVAIENAEDVGYYAAKFIRKLIKKHSVSVKQIEIVGHSLGAHISGFIGRYIQKEFNETIWKIVGMDPANVNFEESNGLEKDDANVVNVIHTDDGGSGKEGTLGNVDFYPNGGAAIQPGCLDEPPNCSHVIVTAYFIEAVENPAAFSSLKCDSYDSYLSGACDENKKVTVGGNLEGVEGKFYFQTNQHKPYSKS